MSAPANITPSWISRYEATVDALVPGIEVTQRRQRCGILYLRDRASNGLRTASWEAGLALQVIEQIASLHWSRRMLPSELEALHGSLLRIMSAAMALETCGPHEVAG